MATVDRLVGDSALENVQSGTILTKATSLPDPGPLICSIPSSGCWINDNRLLDMVECLIGPDIRLIHSRFV